MDTPFTHNPKWFDKIGRIYALLERIKISEEQTGNLLRLRRVNRILSIQATTAIEGNRLTVEQVSAIIDGKPVWGFPKDIKEVQNALSAYELIPDLDPFSIDDFLKAHRLLTSDLVQEAGQFRTVGVAIINSAGKRLHTGADFNDVPDLIAELFDWGKQSEDHPILKSSAIHFMIEHIHPFRDGNGRIGRLWQTLLLYHWNPLFEWIPIETMIHHEQQKYYEALQASHADGIDVRPFIDFILETLENSLNSMEKKPTSDSGEKNGGVNNSANGGVNGGVNNSANSDNINDNTNGDISGGVSDSANGGVSGGVNDSVSDVVNSFNKRIIEMIEKKPDVNAPTLAQQLGLSLRTTQRYLKKLCEQQEIEFRGAPKTGGYWKIDAKSQTKQ